MKTTRVGRLAICAMLSAMSFILSNYLLISTEVLKVSFEGFPILVAAFLFGWKAGAAVGIVGIGLAQLVSPWGISVTTPLWILPFALSGLFVGMYLNRKKFTLTRWELILTIAINEVMITLMNTGVIYIDRRAVGGLPHEAALVAILAPLPLRALICFVKVVIYILVLPLLLKAIRKIEK